MNRILRLFTVLAVLVGAAGCTAQGSAEAEYTSGSETSYAPPPAPEPVAEAEPEPEPVAEPEPEPAPVLEAHDPIRCAGREEITLENVQISNEAGPAITASGRCVVRLTTCSVEASTVAIQVSGTAQVHLSACTVRGAEAAVDARGTAKVQYQATTVEGEVRTAGRAQVAEVPAESATETASAEG